MKKVKCPKCGKKVFEVKITKGVAYSDWFSEGEWDRHKCKSKDGRK